MIWPFSALQRLLYPERPLTKDEQKQRENLVNTIIGLTIWIVASTLLLPICAIVVGLDSARGSGWSNGLALFCHSGMLSLAFAALGALVGFLFGIPKTQQPDKGTGKDSASSSAQASQIKPNTNLEEVSDWLTKIILGAGLTQLMRVPEKIKNIGWYFENDFHGSKLLPEAMAVHSAILGFFIAYLITRLFLTGAFADADRATDASVALALRQSDNQLDRQDYGDATVTLESAMGSIGPETPPETRLLLYERLTNAALYEPAPGSFQKVIKYFNQFTQQEATPPTARLYVNLACAYGQQYEWLTKTQQPPDPGSLQQTRNLALDAVRNALKSDPNSKTILRLVWDPNATKIVDEENDLQSFYKDPEFKSLLA